MTNSNKTEDPIIERIDIGVPGLRLQVKVHRLVHWLRSLFIGSPEVSHKPLKDIKGMLGRDNLNPSYIADTISAVVREDLRRLSTTLHEDDYRKYVTGIVDSYLHEQNKFITIAKKMQINLEGIEEIWLACEPMLDLVNGDQGWLRTSMQLLSMDVNITCFLSEETYLESLKDVLRKNGIAEDTIKNKIRHIPIPNPYDPPVSLWIASNRVIGLQGLNRPQISMLADGIYQLDQPLDPDWLIFLNRSETYHQFDMLRWNWAKAGG